MRRNPLDSLGQLPQGRGVLVVAASALVGLAVAGAVVDHRTSLRRAENVRAAVLAQGFGPARVERIWRAACGRARGGYRWETATARGTACAGPVSDVSLKVLSRRPPP